MCPVQPGQAWRVAGGIPLLFAIQRESPEDDEGDGGEHESGTGETGAEHAGG